MDEQERSLVLGLFASSEAKMLALLEGLSAEHWNFREAPGRWSIAENVEHCILIDTLIMGGIAHSLTKPVNSERLAATVGKDKMLLSNGGVRNVKFIAPEMTQPTGQWADTAALVAEMQAVRARHVEYAAHTQDDLRHHVFPHMAFGDMDGVQWLILMAQHTNRHAAQIEEIKANPQYPQTSSIISSM